jgi:hypothetical protein
VTDRLPLPGLSDSDLELRLIDLGPGLYPTTPDLVNQVRRRLESELAESTLTPRSPLPSETGEGERNGSLLPAPRGEGSGMRGIRGEEGLGREPPGSSRQSS